MDDRRTTSQLRIGDAEREQAAATLGEHFSAGRLDTGEFDQRIQAAYAARTADELRALFEDLPTGPATLLTPPAQPPERHRGRPASDTHLHHHYRLSARYYSWGMFLIPIIIVAVLLWVVIFRMSPLFLLPLLWFVVVYPRRRRAARALNADRRRERRP